jgi:hypothetical protein
MAETRDEHRILIEKIKGRNCFGGPGVAEGYY